MKILRHLCIMLLLGFIAISVCGQPIKGKFAIKNKATGLLLRPLDASKKNETPIVGYLPTNWKCMTWEFTQLSGNTYALRNLFTNKTIEPVSSPTEGVSLKQEPVVAENISQQWEFLPAGKGEYFIRLKGSDLYITASTNEVNSNIILSKLKKDKTQYWSIYEQDPQM